jgi:hypothetical protein
MYRYATTARALRALMAEYPDENPSVFLRDDSFAAYCYDRLTVKELKSAFNRDPDPDDCIRWNLSPLEWKENVEMALISLSPKRSEKSK